MRGETGLDAEKINTRKQYGSETNSIARRGQGGIHPPCGVQRRRLWWGLGQRPNCSTGDHSKGKKTTKGAGSEASLPVTSRFLRSAPKLLFPTPMLCRARWARPCSWSFKHSWSFPQARVSPLRRRQKGNGNGRSPRSPFGNPRCTLLLVEPFHGKGLRNRREKA